MRSSRRLRLWLACSLIAVGAIVGGVWMIAVSDERPGDHLAAAAGTGVALIALGAALLPRGDAPS